MKNRFTYIHVILRILLKSFPYSRFLLLIYYIRFLLKSFYYARISKRKTPVYREMLFGFVIVFRSFPEFIQLFEEIFVSEVYRFESRTPSPFIIDCGSNIGISVLYFKMLYPKSRIIAFEPEPSNFDCLQKNITTNNLNDVQCYGVGLSVAPGRADLYRGFHSPSLNWMLSKPEGPHEHKQILLDQLSRYVNDTVDLLKIDVEGAEHAIIEDLVVSNRMIFILRLIIEYHPKLTTMTSTEFSKRLETLGFNCQLTSDEMIVGTRS
jgi:FkbM family methyltransferase